jgi:hypothetical protein
VDCLIYEEDLIELTCTVSSEGLPDSQLSLDPEAFDIRWYFNNGTEHQLMVDTNVISTGGNGGPVEVRSTLGISAFPSQVNVASLVQGSYYCRVEVDEHTMRTNSSQPFTAQEEDAYFQVAAPCSTEMSFTLVTESACAVHKIAEEPPSTTGNSDSVTSHFDTTSSLEGGASTTFTDTTSPPPSDNPGRSGGGSPLQVWIYVLVAVAAVFAMIIIILAIMCVGLCLRRSQSTMDSANCKLSTSLLHKNYGETNSLSSSAFSTF